MHLILDANKHQVRGHRAHRSLPNLRLQQKLFRLQNAERFHWAMFQRLHRVSWRFLRSTKNPRQQRHREALLDLG